LPCVGPQLKGGTENRWGVPRAFDYDSPTAFSHRRKRIPFYSTQARKFILRDDDGRRWRRPERLSDLFGDHRVIGVVHLSSTKRVAVYLRICPHECNKIGARIVPLTHYHIIHK